MTEEQGVSASQTGLSSSTAPEVAALRASIPDAVRLSERERQALIGMDAPEDFPVFSFRQIAERSGLERQHIRRTVRSLARKGLAEYCRAAFCEDESKLSAGYGLTDEGRRILDGLR